MRDGGACPTRADTDATQTKVRRRMTECRRETARKGGAWPTRTPNSIEPPGAWAPLANLRRPTGPDLAAAGAKDDRERSWGARVSQKSARKCRSDFQNQKKKKSEKRAKNHSADDTKARPLPQRR